MNELGLIIQNDKVVVSSRKVAEIYEKNHQHVLRDIRNIIETVPEALSNFGQTYYNDSQGKEQPAYDMDRQGFSMLVMGFTGEGARRFTYQYTLAFEQMANKLTLKLPTNYKEALIALVAEVEEKEQLQLTVKTLDMENQLLSQENLTWTNRKLIEALVKKLGGTIGYETAWREFKKELLYKHSINLNARLTAKINSTGKKNYKKLDMIHDEELSACISTAVALCKASRIEIAGILNKFQETA